MVAFNRYGEGMITYKMTIAYDGGQYAGWQRLSDKKTIQGKIEETLSKLLGSDIEIFGAGRTDAGVHAMGQVASFSCSKALNVEQVKGDLNHYLPSDIRILALESVKGRFHARHEAYQKHYRYLIQQDIVLPFERDYCILAPAPLDVDRMHACAQVFVGTHDFTAFSNAKIGKKSAVKRIDEVTVFEEEGQIVIDFIGEGFLYHMVRKMVSTLIAAGEGTIQSEEISKMIATKDRSLVPGLAPAKGLFLVGVSYQD